MFHSVRIGQVRRAISEATELVKELRHLQKNPVVSGNIESISSFYKVLRSLFDFEYTLFLVCN